MSEGAREVAALISRGRGALKAEESAQAIRDAGHAVALSLDDPAQATAHAAATCLLADALLQRAEFPRRTQDAAAASADAERALSVLTALDRRDPGRRAVGALMAVAANTALRLRLVRRTDRAGTVQLLEARLVRARRDVAAGVDVDVHLHDLAQTLSLPGLVWLLGEDGAVALRREAVVVICRALREFPDSAQRPYVKRLAGLLVAVELKRAPERAERWRAAFQEAGQVRRPAPS